MWGAIASVAGGLLGSSSASDAADAQAAGTSAAIAENRRQYDQTRQDYAPYRTIGTNALRRLAALYGLSDGTGGGQSEADIRAMLTPQYTRAATPDTYGVVGQGGRDAGPTLGIIPGTPASFDQAGLDAAVQQRLQGQGSGPQTYNDGLDAPIEMDPGYQFGLDQGNQALDRKIAAAGGRVSGAAIKAAQRFGTDYATTGYNSAYQRRQDRINRLSALAGIGQTSTGASAQAGQAASSANSALLSAQGNANGAASLAQGNIWANTGNQLGAIAQRNNWNPFGSSAGSSYGGNYGTSGNQYTMGFGGEY